MKYANYYHPDRYNNDSFNVIDKHHTHNPTYTNRALREAFITHGIELNNPDVNVGKKIEFNLFHDGQATPIDQNELNFLIATENPYICPKNVDKIYLSQFTRVFTWNRNLMNLPNTSLVMIPNQISNSSEISHPNFSNRKIFACIINANKGFQEKVNGDLYKERLAVIKWYEDNFPELFSLFGLGWNKPPPAHTIPEKFIRRLKRLATQTFNYKPFPSYKGEVINKSDVYKNTKFAYCYENAANLPDYISEKIFDAFLSGCVPIYWGSNTISERVPKNCFIDRRDFKNTAEVNKFLLEITEKEYQSYQGNISSYMKSTKSLLFDTTNYVNTILNQVLKDIGHGS